MTVTIASTTDTPVEVKDAAKATKEEFQLTAESDNEAAVAKSMGEDRSSRSDGASVATADSDEAPKEVSESISVEEEESVSEAAPEETVAASEEDVSEEVQPEEHKPKRRRRGRSYKDRASQLAREKASETLRADQLEVALLRLRDQQAAMARPAVPPPPVEDHSASVPETAAAPAPAEVPPTPPAQGARPDQDSFESYEDYAEALVEWKVDQKFQQTEARQHESIARDRAQRAEETAVAAHSARIDAFRGEHEDFDAVVTAGKDLPLSRPMQDAVVNSESGPALMYYLCQNPEECDRIAGMHPVMALKEMGKLEARVETASTGPVSSADSITKAPPPIKPVGGGATASTIPLDQMDYQTYKRTREKQIRAELEGG